MDAITLRCPSCGAPAATDAPNCDHCGARLATAACPKCFHLMFQGSRFCPSCGAEGVEWKGEPASLPCPSCREPMMEGMVGRNRISQCGRCNGMWLGTETFTALCHDADQQSAILGMPGAATPPGNEPVPEVHYRKCPCCSDLMNRVNFARCSGVVIDVCRAHGTWFDRDELHRIILFIRQGGLDRSRTAEVAELEETRRRAESARRFSTPCPPDPPAMPYLGDVDFLVDAARAVGSLLGTWLDRH